MNAKNDTKFKKPSDYPQTASVDKSVDSGDNQKSAPEVFFRLRLMPASLVQYSVERVTIQDDVVIERKVITERDILPITLSKIEDAIIAQVRR